jgi:hypothetical protein
VWRDAEETGRVIEQFVVASWQEHNRQHERVTKRDQARLNNVRAMIDPDRPTTVSRWLTPRARSYTAGGASVSELKRRPDTRAACI